MTPYDTWFGFDPSGRGRCNRVFLACAALCSCRLGLLVTWMPFQNPSLDVKVVKSLHLGIFFTKKVEVLPGI